MMQSYKRVVILGAGPSGLAVAWGLAKKNYSDVTVLEAEEAVGGLSRTRERHGIRFDAGPHRLSTHLDDVLLAVRDLLGKDNLRELPNAHEIYFQGHRYNYPPRLRELINYTSLKLGIVFGCSWLSAVAANLFDIVLGRPRGDSFEKTMKRHFGRSFCEQIIFPVLMKVYGTTDLHHDLARIRFMRGAFGALSRKLLFRSDEFKDTGSCYPLKGFSQIWDELSLYLHGKGQVIETGVRVNSIHADSLQGPFTVTYTQRGVQKRAEADIMVSTIPNEYLLDYLAPTGLVNKMLPLKRDFTSRAMRLGVLVVRDFRLPTRVVIFPEAKYLFDRIAEMNQFADLGYPPGHSILMLDVVCDEGDTHYTEPEDVFNGLLLDSVLRLGWFRENDVALIFSAHYPHTYPVLTPRRYAAQEALDKHLDRSAIVLCGREASTDYNNVHNAMSKGFLTARYISGEVSLEEYKEISKSLGRLPFLDY
jgi:protoporphyrinogen oxidase